MSEKVNTFFRGYPEKKLQKNEVVIPLDEAINEIYFVESGTVKMFALSDEGEEIVLHAFREQAYFPVMLLLGEQANSYGYTTIEPTTVRVAPAAEVLAFLKSEPDVLLDLTTRLSSALLGLLVRIEGSVFQKSYIRVIGLFLYLAEKFGKKKSGGVVISLTLTHQEIAAWLGLARETVSRQIETLQKKRLVLSEDRHFVIPDIEKLRSEQAL